MKRTNHPTQRRKIAIWLPLILGIGAAIYFFAIRVPNYPKIPQAWTSRGIEMANTDSLAAYRNDDGTVIVAATSKWKRRVDLFDAQSGTFLRSISHEGLVRPNGIAAAYIPVQSIDTTNNDDEASNPNENGMNSAAESPVQTLLVVDRDAPGLFIFNAASGNLLSQITDDLKNPYGITSIQDDDALMIFITDVSRKPEDVVARYRITAQRDAANSDEDADSPLPIILHIEPLGTFGDTEDGRIGKAESIVIDGPRGRIYLCDEDRDARNMKVFQPDGTFTGTTFGDGIINGDPEGIVIVNDADAGDFILVTDQTRRITAWHAFDAQSLEYITSLTGDPRIANTDGICIYEGAIPGFDGGGLFAVHDDAEVFAYDLADIRDLVRAARKAIPSANP